MRRYSLLSLLLLSLMSLRGENGRDFAGQYAVTNIVESADAVRATFTLRLGNYSGSNIAGARILLETGEPGKSFLLGENIAVENHSHNRIQVEIVLSHREFERWQRGGQPHLAVESADQNGHSVRRPVELIHEPFIPVVR
jgi:hypothetical protein